MSITPNRSHAPWTEAPWLWRWAVPSAILLVAFGLRVWRLGDANVWWDEALAVWATRKGLLETTLWTAGDVHPPLFFWFIWVWSRWVGESEFALRFLPASFGLLTVAVVYVLGCRVGRSGTEARLVGSLAALLTALARFHIWWSQELRMYGLAGLLGTLSLYLLLRWLDAELGIDPPVGPRLRRVVWLVLYLLSTAAALYTILLSVAFVLAHNGVVFLAAAGTRERTQRRGLLGRWVVAQGVLAATLALWLLVSWGRMRTWPCPPS